MKTQKMKLNKSLFIHLRFCILFVLTFSFIPAISQDCNVDISNDGTYTLGPGDVGCLSADMDGTVNVNDGGILIICGQYTMSTSINVQPGGRIILTAASSIGFTGSVTINSGGPGTTAIDFFGDPNCHAQLYKAGPNVGLITGPNPAVGSWGISNDASIHLVDFVWSWGAGSTKGSASTGTITNLCPAPTSCEDVSGCTIPTVNTSSGDEICNAGTGNLTATASAGKIRWYTSSTGGSPIDSSNSGANWTTPHVTTTTDYYAEAADESCISEARTKVTLTVSAGPDAGTPTNTTLCTIDGIFNLNNQLTNADGGGQWTPSNSFDPSTDLPGKYTYTVSGSGVCSGEDDISEVTINVDEAPDAGSSTNANLCSSNSILNLDDQLTNADAGGEWTPAGQFDPAIDIPGKYTYRVLGTGACVGEEAISEVTITVQEAPNAGEVNNADLCSSDDVLNLDNQLTGADTGGAWSPSGSFDPSSDSPNDYTYKVTGTGACADEVDSVTMSISVQAAPEAGTATDAELCPSDSLINLDDQLSNADIGGTWTPSNNFDPSSDSPGDYTYRVNGTGACANESDSVIVSINLQASPNAGKATNAELCSSDTILVLDDQLSNSDKDGIWTPSNIFDPSSDSPGDYTYKTTGKGACANQSDSVTVSITVQQAPDAGTPNNAELCSSDSVLSLFNQLTNADSDGVWTPSDSFDPSSDSAQDYTYTVTGKGACANKLDSVIVSISVQLAPNAGTANNAELCSSDTILILDDQLSNSDEDGVWTPSDRFDPSSDTAQDYIYNVNGSGACAHESDSVIVPISVQATPNAGTGNSPSLCSSDELINLNNYIINADSNGIWEPSERFDPQTDSAGIYTYTVIGTGACLSKVDSTQLTIQVQTAPNAGNGAPIFLCSTDSPLDLNTHLTNTTPGGTWSPTALINPAIDTSNMYVYKVSGIDACSDQVDSVTVIATVVTSPIIKDIQLEGDALCPNSTKGAVYELTATVQYADEFSWTSNKETNFSSSNEATTTASFTAENDTTWLYLEAISLACPSRAKDSIPVFVSESYNPLFQIEGDSSCINDNGSYKAINTGESIPSSFTKFMWILNRQDTLSIADSVEVFNIQANDSLELIVTGSFCLDSSSTTYQSLLIPSKSRPGGELTINGQTSHVLENVSTLSDHVFTLEDQLSESDRVNNNLSNPTSWSFYWLGKNDTLRQKNNDGLIFTPFHSEYIAQSDAIAPNWMEDSYTVTYLMVTSNGLCEDTSKATLMVKYDLFIPNVFTPNGDDNFDTWSVENGEAYGPLSIEIFNRWGNMVYNSSDWDNAWKGVNNNGDELPFGTYFYILHTDDDNLPVFNGPVTILK